MDKVIARCILALIIHREETSQRALFDQERKKAAFECDSYQKWLFLLPLLRLWALMPCFHLRLVSLVRTPQLPDEPWGSSFSPFVWLPPSRRVKGKLLNKLRRNWMNYGRAWFTTPPHGHLCVKVFVCLWNLGHSCTVMSVLSSWQPLSWAPFAQ